MATSTIGNLGGEDYATATIWEAATDNDLVTATDGEIGQLTGPITDKVTMSGATTSATYYRTLTYASGAKYDLATDTGAELNSSTSGTMVQVDEDYFRADGIHLSCEYSGGGDLNGFVFGDYTGIVISDCVGRSVGSGSYIMFRVNYTSVAAVDLRKCIAIGSGASFEIGFYLTGENRRAYNCVAYGFTSRPGFYILDQSKTAFQVRN